MKTKFGIVLFTLFLISQEAVLSAADAVDRLTVFYAAGLNASMNEMVKDFERMHPAVKISAESSGSLLAVRKVTELGRKADLLLLADELIIKDLLIPKYADWYLRFYQDSIVIAYTDKSKYTNEINGDNWHRILLRPNVRYAYANPNLAPIGYRTLMCWQLADAYYQDKEGQKGIYQAFKEGCSDEYKMPDVADMLNLLESFYLDYAFVYESTAKQHNLKHIRLPDDINLGNPHKVDIYERARVEITPHAGSAQTITGGPITFSLTILKESPNIELAAEFVKFMLGPEGRRILERNSQTPMDTYEAYNPDMVPPALKEVLSRDTFRK